METGQVKYFWQMYMLPFFVKFYVPYLVHDDFENNLEVETGSTTISFELQAYTIFSHCRANE